MISKSDIGTVVTVDTSYKGSAPILEACAEIGITPEEFRANVLDIVRHPALGPLAVIHLLDTESEGCELSLPIETLRPLSEK